MLHTTHHYYWVKEKSIELHKNKKKSYNKYFPFYHYHTSWHIQHTIKINKCSHGSPCNFPHYSLIIHSQISSHLIWSSTNQNLPQKMDLKVNKSPYKKKKNQSPFSYTNIHEICSFPLLSYSSFSYIHQPFSPPLITFILQTNKPSSSVTKKMAFALLLSLRPKPYYHHIIIFTLHDNSHFQ